jgi:hypothetical protein
MRQWEYHKIDLNDLPRRTNDMDLLNDAGRNGWELVILSQNAIAYLKRPTTLTTAGEAKTPTTSKRGSTRKA